ncbi:MAG: chondroitinase family polysaccharide lyase [Verrucomicrobiota bacterium]
MYRSVFTFIVALGASSALGADKVSSDFQILESFEDGIPEGLSATGQLELDQDRIKHGAKSVRWDWQGNDRFIFDRPIGYRKQQPISEGGGALEHTDSSAGQILEPPRGFFVWVYNDEARPQRLRIEFGRGDEVDCWFDYNLNFKGWRTIWLTFDRGDMKGVPHEDMDRLTINAPNTGSGTFYFDTFGFGLPINPRTVGGNPQLPSIDPHPRLVSQYEHFLYWASQQRSTEPVEPLTDAILADLRQVEDQATNQWLSKAECERWNDDKMKGIEKRFSAFGIRRDGDNIYGRPLLKTNVMTEYFSELGLAKEELMPDTMTWKREFGPMLLSIARAWHCTKSQEAKNRLEEMFINLFDYGVDQGFDHGAGLGWIHHYSYEIREIAPAMFLMREPLARNERLDKAVEICKWFHGFNQVYRPDMAYGWQGRKACDADDMQGLLASRLLCALMMPDSPEKVRDLRQFSHFFSEVSTAYANALDETFKPDGTIFHHGGHAYGYGGRAIFGAARTYDILKDTQFRATENARKRIAKVATTYYDGLFTDDWMTPKAFASIRFSNYKSPNSFRNMHDLFDDSYEPLNGFRMLPYSCVGFKRRGGDWMITARGHSKFVYAFESWGRNYFAFPQFIANGYLDVSYPDSIDSLTPTSGSDIWNAGIDWCRIPGATTVKLPFEKIATRVGQVRDEAGEYIFSDQAFSGGVESTYGAGIQVFQFTGHDKYDLESFSGKKTWFFFGNKVVCLGSDIESDVEGYPVETTIFQNSLAETIEPIIVNGSKVDRFPFDDVLEDTQPNWVIDNRGTGFYFPQATVQLTRAEQTNPDSNFEESVSGDFTVAWIDHGIAPKQASYEYVLLAATNEEEMKTFTKQPSIAVVQHDSIAHVVHSSEENSTAYAVYSPQGAKFDSGLVVEVSKQAVFLLKEEEGTLRLSLADPDLNIYDGQEDRLPDGSRIELSIYEREWFFWPSRPHHVRLALKGRWEISDLVVPMETAQSQPTIISSDDDLTVIEFECRDGLSTEIVLTAQET